MIRSMTGFGAAAVDDEALQATVSVRSLNHRFLDLHLHVTPSLQALERDVKVLVESRLRRGRVEVWLQAAFHEPEGDVVVASRPLVAGLVRALRGLKAEHNLTGDVTVSDVARFPGTLEVASAGLDDARRRALLDLLARGLDALDEMRRAEGVNLAEELRGRLQAIEDAAARIEALNAEGQQARRTSLLEKARELLAELSIDDNRLYTELARLIDRFDVAEELQRLRSHVSLARESVASEAASGKRLDFLAQEMAREANTIGSKAAAAPVVHAVVALKTDVERLREQVQNLE
jgi:uncharacterized protein (TIGR00255 family)